MTNQQTLSRRVFCLCCLSSVTLATCGSWLSPSQVFAKARNIVDLIRNEAARAPIKVRQGMLTSYSDTINPDLLAFIRS
jgi:hypothetical protein